MHDFQLKFINAREKLDTFPETADGELMIAVSDVFDSSKEGINNVIVFAEGHIESPVITRVLEIDEYNETELDKVRRHIYETERRGIQQETGGVFRRYTSVDYGSYSGSKNNISGIGHNLGVGQYGGRRGSQTQKIKRLKVNKMSQGAGP